MNRLLELIRNIMVDGGGNPQSKPSKSKGSKRDARRKTKRKRTSRHQTHFYDPDRPENTLSSSDDLGLGELDRRQTDTVTRIEDAEAALAKERKRIEQLEYRRREAESREEQRRLQHDADAGLSPREKNRKAFDRAVARVERNALRKIEELERRFAHSDKVFELNLARQDMEENEQREREAAEKKMEYQRQSEQHHPSEPEHRVDQSSATDNATGNVR
jgi:hypothetical protein